MRPVRVPAGIEGHLRIWDNILRQQCHKALGERGETLMRSTEPCAIDAICTSCMTCIWPLTRIIAAAPSSGKVLAIAFAACTGLIRLSDDYIMVVLTSGSGMFTQYQDEDDEPEHS